MAFGRRLWAGAGDLLVALALFAASFALYLETLAPSVAAVFDDSLEFPLAIHRLAILHPTGYPLYALLGRLFALLPGGNVAWAVNLLSAVAGALAVSLVFLVARTWTRRRWTSLLGASALAVSPVFWSQAVIAEVYTLNALLVAALLWLVTRWAKRPLAPVVPFARYLVDRQDRLAGREQGDEWSGETDVSASGSGVHPVGGSATVDPVPDGMERPEPAEASGADDLPSRLAEEAQPVPQHGQVYDEETLVEPGRSQLWVHRLPPALQGTAARSHQGTHRLRPALSSARSHLRRFSRRFLQAVVWMHTQARKALDRLVPILRPLIDLVRGTYRRLLPAVPARRRLRPGHWLYALAACFGMALAHHRTIVLLAPALLLFIVLVERRVLTRAALLGPEYPGRPRVIQIAGRPAALLALCLFVPILLYVYLPLRGHVGSLDGSYVDTWRGFWRWVTASSYGAFFGENPLARDLDAVFYVDLFWRQFGPVGLALALVGLLGLASRARNRAWPGLALTSVAFAAYVAFAVVYRVPDVEVFFIPAFLITAIWIGVGLDDAADLLRIRGPSLALRRVLAVSGCLLAAAALAQPLAIAVGGYPDLDLSRRWIVHDYGAYVLEQPLPRESAVVGLLGEMTLLRTFQETTGRGATIETVAANDETARREAVEAALGRDRAVYITRSLPGLTANHSLDAVIGIIDVLGHLETLVRVTEPDGVLPEVPRPVELEPYPGLQLLGYGVMEHRGHWQAWARLRLWWRARDGLDRPLKISARLLDQRGHLASSADAEPVSSLYPTTAWRPGEVVADAYEIPLPAGLPPGDYRPLVVVYEPTTGAELGRVELATVSLQGNPTRPPRRALEASIDRTQYARLGDLELLGFTGPDPDVAYGAGQALPLTLLWQARGQPAGDLQLVFRLEGDVDVILDQEPVGGECGTALWVGGQVVRQWPTLIVPVGVHAGTYRLKMRVTRDGQPVPWGLWIVPLGSDLDLGPVRLGN